MSHPFGKSQYAGHYRPNLNAMSPRRQQAIDAFPFLQGILPGTPGESCFQHVNSVTYPLTPQQREAIWDAVDHERPLLPLLSEHLGWEPWMVRHVQHHWPVFNEIDGLYAHHAWDIGALLVNWTPETAPRRLMPLQRLCSLFCYATRPFPKVLGRSFFDLPKHGLNAHDRCTLLAIIEEESHYARFCEYLDFLHTLESWLCRRCGKAVGGIMPRLVGARTIADWWILCLRWHRINDELRHERAVPDWPTDAPATSSLTFLTEPVHRGPYSFHNLQNPRYRPRAWKSDYSYQDLPTSPTPRFPPGTIYVELDGIHHVTLSIALDGSAHAPKIRVLSSADRNGWSTLDADTQTAVDQFVADCNAGRNLLNRETVEFYRYGATLRASLLEKFRRVDYPSWLRLFAKGEYFDAHADMSGAAVFDAYRESLELVETAHDGLFHLAMAAVQRVGEPDFEFIEIMSDDADNE